MANSSTPVSFGMTLVTTPSASLLSGEDTARTHRTLSATLKTGIFKGLNIRRYRRSQYERYRVLEVRIQDVRPTGADLAEHTRALRGFEIESFVRSIARRSRVTTR